MSRPKLAKGKFISIYLSAKQLMEFKKVYPKKTLSKQIKKIVLQEMIMQRYSNKRSGV